jgi:DNA-binding transcriptional regulator YiaG
METLAIAHPMSKLPTMTPDELRAIRAELGLTQKEVAIKLGAALDTVKKWEQGKREIPGPAAELARLRLALHRRSIVI